jgi:thioredoxin-like negative regulator of GroEL
MAFSSRGLGDRARRGRQGVEKLMRSLPRVLLTGFVGLGLSAPVIGQRADDQIQTKSVELQRQARTLIAAGKLEQADDMLETSLAVDPRNRGAFVDLARVAEKQHLFGKAMRMTSKALLLEPNDPDAIAVQGEAMVEMGAVARAQANLQKLQQICGAKGCPQIAQLSAAISRGPTVASAKAPEVPKTN